MSKVQQDFAQKTWESFVSERDLLISVYGKNYGEEPETKKGLIKENFRRYAGYLESVLELRPDDVLMDFGSGTGVIADFLAPKVQKVYAVDVSRNHLEYLKNNVENREKIVPTHISYAGVDQLKDVTKIYSANVLIHFNQFDIALHLEAFAKVLPAGGKLVFNMQDYDHLVLQRQPMFQGFLNAYRQSHSSAWLVQWHSAAAVLRMADFCGFDGTIGQVSDQGNTHLILVKR